MASFLKPHEPTSANFIFFFCSFFSQPLHTVLKRVRNLLWIKLWLKWMLWLVWSSIQTTKVFSISAIKLFQFLIICVFTGVALLISFRSFSFAFITWLTLWCERPSFWSFLVFDLPSSLSLMIFFLVFLGPHPWHMEVTRLGVELGL